MTPRFRDAPHNGVCKVCGRRIHKGDRTFYAKHWGMVCSSECMYGEQPPERPEPTAQEPAGAKPAFRGTDGVYRYEFGSVSEAVKDALEDFAQNAHNRTFLNTRIARALSGVDSWASRFTRERFLAELSNPARQLSEAVDRMREKLVGEIDFPKTPGRRGRHGQEFGESMDADRYLARDPMAWDRSVRVETPRRTITIGVNLSVNCDVNGDEMMWRGAAALALADILQTRGFNVEIVAFSSTRGPTDKVRQSVMKYLLKDSTMPLDIGAITFALCEIAWFRVVGAVGGIRHLPGKASSGLGSAAILPTADCESLDFLVDTNVLGEERATEWVKGCLANTTNELEACNA